MFFAVAWSVSPLFLLLCRSLLMSKWSLNHAVVFVTPPAVEVIESMKFLTTVLMW